MFPKFCSIQSYEIVEVLLVTMLMMLTMLLMILVVVVCIPKTSIELLFQMQKKQNLPRKVVHKHFHQQMNFFLQKLRKKKNKMRKKLPQK
jgi:hypothetical protein